MVCFSKEHDRNVFSRPFYSVKWGPQNLVITAPARIGFIAFNRVCSIGHPVIYDTARVITKGSNPTKSDQSGPTPFLCGLALKLQFNSIACNYSQPINRPSWGFITREMPWKSVRKRARQAGSHPAVRAEGLGAGVGKRRQLQSN